MRKGKISSLTTWIAGYVDEIHDLDGEDRERLRLLLLDYCAASIAGYHVNRDFNASAETVIKPNPAGSSYVLMSPEHYTASDAAFLNALYAHGAELDDGNREAMGHVGCHVLPALFAVSDEVAPSGVAFGLAVVAGYEVYIRIARAAQPGMVARGFHSTGMAGSIACAAACAKLMDLNVEGIENAMAIASTMSSGLLSVGDSRQMSKPVNPATAARNGVLAALMAAQGAQGPLECLEGPNGWFHAVTSEFDFKRVFECADGERRLIHECYTKRFPSCRHTHCGLDAGLALSARCKVADIVRIEVFIYPNAIKLAGQIAHPRTADEAKFSIAYTLACALRYGDYGIGRMNPANADEEVERLIEAIELVPSPAMEDRARGIRGTRLRVTLRDGSAFEEEVLIPKGDPENPMTWDETADKLAACASGLLSADCVKNVVRAVSRMNFDDAPVTNPLDEVLAGDGACERMVR